VLVECLSPARLPQYAGRCWPPKLAWKLNPPAGVSPPNRCQWPPMCRLADQRWRRRRLLGEQVDDLAEIYEEALPSRLALPRPEAQCKHTFHGERACGSAHPGFSQPEPAERPIFARAPDRNGGGLRRLRRLRPRPGRWPNLTYFWPLTPCFFTATAARNRLAFAVFKRRQDQLHKDIGLVSQVFASLTCWSACPATWRSATTAIHQPQQQGLANAQPVGADDRLGPFALAHKRANLVNATEAAQLASDHLAR